MPSAFSHPAVPVALGLIFGRKRIPRPLLVAGIFCSAFPDADCLGFAVGVPYESQFGHRGFMHSIVFALLMAAVFAWQNKAFLFEGEVPMRKMVFAFIFASTLSHPLLDMLTTGGLGIALFWPFTAERFFFPWHVIPVSPIGRGFFSAQGLAVFLAELEFVWLPCLMIGFAGLGVRKLAEKKAA